MPEALKTAMSCGVEARVTRCDRPCREHVRIELAAATFPSSEPGQFLQLLCRESDSGPPVVHDWLPERPPSLSDKDLQQRRALLRRPFSIADRWTADDGASRLCVISRAVGAGTRWLLDLRPGDVLDVTGPLGRGFRLPERAAPVLLIGGGVGIPPMLYLARRLHELRWADATAIFGVRARDLLPVALHAQPAADAEPRDCVAYPAGAAIPTAIASDDGSVGMRGLVTDALLAWHRRRGGDAQRITVFACGPEAMLKAVAHETRRLGLACQLCVERQMGCGLGTCLSCTVRVRDAAATQGWRWALACQDGPVFDRDDLLDYWPGSAA